MTNKTSELDEYFPRSVDETELSNGNDQPDEPDIDDQLETFVAQINATLDELLPGANGGKRKAILTAACSTAEMPVLFDKQPAEYWIEKIRQFVANVEKKAGKTAEPRLEVSIQGDPEFTKFIKHWQGKGFSASDLAEILGSNEAGLSFRYWNWNDAAIREAAYHAVGAFAKNLEAKRSSVSLPEAPFSATVKLLADGTVDSWLVTVRGNSVEEGTDLMAQLMKMVRAKVEMKPTKRADSPSNAKAPASAPKPGNNAPVRSFDPDADGKPQPTKGEVLHEKVCQIEKVMAQDGKVQINLYPVLSNGGEAQFPSFYLKSDADKEEVYKHIDVDAMQLAERYNFPATVDYVLSTKLNKRGNPYRNMRAIHPE